MTKKSKPRGPSEARYQEPRWIVQGKGDPAIDVPAVQSAIDSAPEDGRTVYLKGTFSFEDQSGARQVTIKNWARIIGFDEFGNRAIIQGGNVPFKVASNDQAVSISGVHFVSPKLFAIQITSVKGLSIANCKIDKVTPVLVTLTMGGNTYQFHNAGGINASGPNVSGNLNITDNEIDVGGSSSDRTFGILFSGVGSQTAQATIVIAKNKVSNVTAHGVDVRDINGTGRATIELNEIRAGVVGGQNLSLPDKFVDGIRCVGKGTYIVVDNLIYCGYQNSAGIRLQSSPTAQIKEARVGEKIGPRGSIEARPNQINMGPYLTVAADTSENAAIELRRNCALNTVSNNKIAGQARAVLSLIAEPNITPSDKNTFVDNDHQGFTSEQADIFVCSGVSNTKIQGGTGGTIWDEGVGTIHTPKYLDVM